MSLNREASWLAPALALHRATVHSTSCGRHELEVRSSRSSVIERRWKLMRLGEGSRGGGRGMLPSQKGEDGCLDCLPDEPPKR